MVPTLQAQSSFDGTWKVDFESAMPTKINVWLLQNGKYKCVSCTPTIEVEADGTDQPTKGQPFDTISVAILDRQTVREIEKKNGQIVSDEKFTVSADGNTVKDEFANWKLTMTRVEKAPAGAHALSGSWKPVKIESISDRELLVTYQLLGDNFSMSRPTGQSYTAKLNGPDAPYKGDPEIDAVALKRVNKDLIEETDKLRGKPVSVLRISVGVDGKYMTVSSKDLRDGSTNEFAMKKQ
jgi:hypothetical protein